MIDLGKIERLAGFSNNPPPCSEENYQTALLNNRLALQQWRNEMEDNCRYLDLLEFAGIKTQDQGRYEDAKATTEYKRRAIELISPQQTFVEKVNGKQNGRHV